MTPTTFTPRVDAGEVVALERQSTMRAAASDRVEPLRYLEPEHARIEGTKCDDMTLRTATGRALGRVDGFIIDPAARRVAFFVVRRSGLLGRLGETLLVPITAARVNLSERTIELLANEADLHPDAFNVSRFPAFSDEDAVTAIFAPRS